MVGLQITVNNDARDALGLDDTLFQNIGERLHSSRPDYSPIYELGQRLPPPSSDQIVPGLTCVDAIEQSDVSLVKEPGGHAHLSGDAE